MEVTQKRDVGCCRACRQSEPDFNQPYLLKPATDPSEGYKFHYAHDVVALITI